MADSESPAVWSHLNSSEPVMKDFNVLLSVHHAMILGNCPNWRTIFFPFIYLFIVLYMFPACHAHHQEKQIVSIQLLVIYHSCWWQCRVLAPDDEHDMLETCREL